MLRFLAYTLLVSVISLSTTTTIDAQPLILPPLPYPYDALEPCISEATLRSHHLSHHQTYTDRTNTVLTQLRANPDTKHLARLGLDTLIQHIHNLSLPLSDEQRTTLRNNGGGYINHIHYFESLTPPLVHSASSSTSGSGGGNRSIDDLVDLLPADTSEVSALIAASFGSFDAFKQSFTSAALSLFGSGWTWLTYSPALHSLSIQSTTQQDSPWMEEGWVSDGGVVLLGLDLWEHSYYLDVQSKRAEYVRRFWKIVNWQRVEQRLVQRTSSAPNSSAAKKHEELR